MSVNDPGKGPIMAYKMPVNEPGKCPLMDLENAR